MGEVVDLHNIITGLHISPDKVLSGAIGNLSEVVVIGIDKKGNRYVASSEPLSTAVYLLELAKYELLGMED